MLHPAPCLNDIMNPAYQEPNFASLHGDPLAKCMCKRNLRRGGRGLYNSIAGSDPKSPP